MFTENEIATMIEIPEILEFTVEVKKDFITNEANFLEINDHDFLSLIMMTPTVGMALANGSISLFEELALNKMARKMSKGGFFMKIDPVAHGMKFLIKNYDVWQDKFYKVIRKCMEVTFDLDSYKDFDEGGGEFSRMVMKTPYIFVRFISSFFLHDDSDVVETRSISKVEYEKIEEIGSKLVISDFPVFKAFCNTFEVK